MTELEAIQDIGKQIDGFKATLGEKADKAAFEKVNKTLEEMKANVDKWNDAKLEDKMNTVNEAITKFGTQVQEMQEAIRIQKDNGGNSSKNELFDPAELKAFVDSTFVDGRKTSAAASFKINNNMIFPHRNKAAEIIGADAFVSGSTPDVYTGRTIDPTFYQRTRKRNLILDHIPITSTNAPTLYYMEKREVSGGASTDVGGADFIAVAGAKPLRSFRMTTGKVDAKKVAILSTVADKLLRDVASLDNWVREDLMDEVMEEYNLQLLTSDGTGDDPLGLLENAVPFSVTTAFTANVAEANEINAIVAACSSMAVSKETPVKCMVSVDIFYKIHALKGSNGQWLNNALIYTNSLGQLFIAGVEIVGVDNDDIDGAHFLLIGANLGFKIKNYNSLVFERGLNGEDFKYDRTSFRCFQEVLSYIPTHRYNSVMYDTFENVYSEINLAEA